MFFILNLTLASLSIKTLVKLGRGDMARYFVIFSLSKKYPILRAYSKGKIQQKNKFVNMKSIVSISTVKNN